MDLYAENILDHYRHPRAKQVLTDASVTHGEKNLSCGDAVELQLNIDGDRISGIGWQGEGCAISQAGMSILSEVLEGMTLDDAANLPSQHVYDLLGVPVGPRRHKCALLCLHTLKNALHVYRKQPAQSWIHTVLVDDKD